MFETESTIKTHVNCVSHVLIRIQVKPSMDQNPKLRFQISVSRLLDFQNTNEP